MKVLFVGVDSSGLRQVETFLEDEDERFDIHTANSAEEGLQKLSENDYDATVSGYQMSGMDGLNFLKTVRGERDSDIPFIIFTGEGGEDIAMEALDLGVDRYLEKSRDSKSQYRILANTIIGEINRSRVEREKEKAQDKWQTTFDALPEIVALISPDYEFIRINEKGAESLGMDREDIIGKKCYEIVHSQNEPIDQCPCTKVLETGEPDVGEIFEEDERYYITSASPISDDDGEVEAFAHTVKDITELKQTEEELRESEEKFRKYVENAPNGVFVVDGEGNYVEVNEAACEMTGYSEEELLEMDISDVVPSEDWGEALEAFEELLKSGKMRVELPYIRKDESRGYWIINAAKVSEGRYIGFQEDITERKEVEERKKFLRTLLRQDLMVKCQSIHGYLSLLQEADIPNEYEKHLEGALEGFDKADEILSLAREPERIEKSDWVAEKDVFEVISNVLQDISDLVESEEVEVEENYSDDVDMVLGDSSLNTLFSELLKTRVRISGCDKVKIGVDEVGDEVLVSVEDNGEDLPSEVEDLFSGRVYSGETTGVGGFKYYIIRRIAEHNDIRIEVKGSELGGARFDMYCQKA